MNACVAWGYGVSYLSGYGFSAGVLGTMFALFALGAAVVQPLIGRIIDRSKRFHWKRVLLFLTIITLILIASLLFIRNRYMVAVIFCLYSMTINITMSLVNVVCVYYEHHGRDMNFGVARGIGSLTYAVLSVLIGQLIAPLGMQVVLYAGIIVALFTVLCTASFPYLGPTPTESGEQPNPSEKKNALALIAKYPAFFLMVVAVALFLTFQNMTSNYMVLILEAVGGDHRDLGIVLSLAAVLEIPIMFLTGFMLRHFKAWWLMTFSGVLYAVRGVLYYFAGSVAAIYLLQILQPFTYAILVSVQVFFSDQCMEPEDLATGQAFMGTAQAVGATLGFFLGGVSIDRSGVSSMLLFATVLSAIGAFLAAVSAIVCSKRENKGKGK